MFNPLERIETEVEVEAEMDEKSIENLNENNLLNLNIGNEVCEPNVELHKQDSMDNTMEYSEDVQITESVNKGGKKAPS